MPAYSELTGLALVVLAAAISGVAMTRLRQPAIVGYILAGVVLGPSGLGLVQNRGQVGILADLGILLLLFMIGMELSLRGFRGVWRTAVLATALQIAASVGVTLGLSYLFDWSLGMAVLLGFVIALSSTAVVIKMLETMNILRSPVAQITVGVLIAQDLAVVPMILTLDTLSGGSFNWRPVPGIVLSVVFLVLLIIYLSRRKKIHLPFARLVAGNRELTPLRGLAFCFGAAAVSGLAGLSPAYGAFLAGLVIGNSTERPAMYRSIQPIESILIMAFFLSIGLLIDLNFIWHNLGTVLLILFIITVFKTALNISVLRLAGQPWAHAFITGILLAQIGEFSFLLGQTGAARGLIGAAEMNLIVSVTALSLVISPLWQMSARRLLRIAILSVTSRPEMLRLFFGRHGLPLFAVWTALRRWASRVLGRTPAPAAAGNGAGDAGPGPDSDRGAMGPGQEGKGGEGEGPEGKGGEGKGPEGKSGDSDA